MRFIIKPATFTFGLLCFITLLNACKKEAEIVDCTTRDFDSCQPLITSPKPGETLDNGCNANVENGSPEIMEWTFQWKSVRNATEYNLLIEHPDVGQVTFDKILTTNEFIFKEDSQINTYFTDWTAKVRAKVDGVWGPWYGSSDDETLMLFNVEEVNTDCN